VSQALVLKSDEPNYAARAAWIVEQLRAGRTMTAVGQDLHLCRERVRQIALEHDITAQQLHTVKREVKARDLDPLPALVKIAAQHFTAQGWTVRRSEASSFRYLTTRFLAGEHLVCVHQAALRFIKTKTYRKLTPCRCPGVRWAAYFISDEQGWACVELPMTVPGVYFPLEGEPNRTHRWGHRAASAYTLQVWDTRNTWPVP
jgi:hypothetical protein